MEEMKLSLLKPYNACMVVSVDESGGDTRLTDMGITKGAVITRLFSAPCGEPTAYLVKGTTVALRKAEADRITVCISEPSI